MGGAAATPEVLVRLVQHLDDAEGHVCDKAAEALGRMGAAAATPEVLTRLVRRLVDGKGVVREKPAEALGRMGRAAATAKVLALLTAEWVHVEHASVGKKRAETLASFLRSGVRWFRNGHGQIRITTVDALSGEKSAPV
jgi:hypothetical protein